MTEPTENIASDGQARLAARRVGLVARKSRWRRGSIDNFGGYKLIDIYQNSVAIAGERFNLTAEDVVEWCRGRRTGEWRELY